jgi:hypothetical protein
VGGHRNLELAADLAGSFGDIGTNPTAPFDIDVTLEGASIGTISVATDGTFTFTTEGGTPKQIAAGERLEVVGPAVAGATAADIALTLAATIVA